MNKMKLAAVILALALVFVPALSGCTGKKGITVTDPGSSTEVKKAITKEEMTANDGEDASMTVNAETELESLPESSESALLPEGDMVTPQN